PVGTDDKEKVNGTSTARSSGADDETPSRPTADESSGGRDLTQICEKELRRTADLIRFFANRLQMGEESKSVIADMRQQETKRYRKVAMIDSGARKTFTGFAQQMSPASSCDAPQSTNNFANFQSAVPEMMLRGER